MITILGKNLLNWAGIFAALFFALAFFGCRCNFKWIRNNWLNKHHNLFMRLGFILMLIHIGLLILGRSFGIWI